MQNVNGSQPGRRPFWLALIVMVAAAAVLVIIQQTGQVAAPASSFPLEIQPAEVQKLRDEGAFLIDVRQPEEYAESHIPGVSLIPLGELAGRLSEVPQDKTVVVICQSGRRSAQGRDILLNAGYTQVTSMAGGMNSWANTGYSTETGSG